VSRNGENPSKIYRYYYSQFQPEVIFCRLFRYTTSRSHTFYRDLYCFFRVLEHHTHTHLTGRYHRSMLLAKNKARLDSSSLAEETTGDLTLLLKQKSLRREMAEISKKGGATKRKKPEIMEPAAMVAAVGIGDQAPVNLDREEAMPGSKGATASSASKMSSAKKKRKVSSSSKKDLSTRGTKPSPVVPAQESKLNPPLLSNDAAELPDRLLQGGGIIRGGDLGSITASQLLDRATASDLSSISRRMAELAAAGIRQPFSATALNYSDFAASASLPYRWSAAAAGRSPMAAAVAAAAEFNAAGMLDRDRRSPMPPTSFAQQQQQQQQQQQRASDPAFMEAARALSGSQSSMMGARLASSSASQYPISSSASQLLQSYYRQSSLNPLLLQASAGNLTSQDLAMILSGSSPSSLAGFSLGDLASLSGMSGGDAGGNSVASELAGLQAAAAAVRNAGLMGGAFHNLHRNPLTASFLTGNPLLSGLSGTSHQAGPLSNESQRGMFQSLAASSASSGGVNDQLRSSSIIQSLRMRSAGGVGGSSSSLLDEAARLQAANFLVHQQQSNTGSPRQPSPSDHLALAAAAVSSNLLPTSRRAIVLFMQLDGLRLSPFQCLARKQIELFAATDEDVQSGSRGRNNPIVVGQVGIRCVHCAKLPASSRKRGNTYFPTKFDRVYQTAVNMATGHLCQHCDHVPPAVRAELLLLREQKSTGGGKKNDLTQKCGLKELLLFES
jgi:hypothetical protein